MAALFYAPYDMCGARFLWHLGEKPGLARVVPTFSTCAPFYNSGLHLLIGVRV